MTNREFKLIERISNEHCRKTFGYLNEDDLKNEIWAICLEKLPEYSRRRGKLEHFLRVAVKSRLVNRFKDITKSVRSPCPRCPYHEPDEEIDCYKYKHLKSSCAKWRNYQLSIESRNSLLNAAEPQQERFANNDPLDKAIDKELRELVYNSIDKAYLHDFDLLISGGKLSKQRTKRLKREIIQILAKHGVKPLE